MPKKTFLEKLNGWKTVIGAVGTPIASAIVLIVPSHTTAYKIAIGFNAIFGITGIAGVAHKAQKGELPTGLRGNDSRTIKEDSSTNISD